MVGARGAAPRAKKLYSIILISCVIRDHVGNTHDWDQRRLDVGLAEEEKGIGMVRQPRRHGRRRGAQARENRRRHGGSGGGRNSQRNDRLALGSCSRWEEPRVCPLGLIWEESSWENRPCPPADRVHNPVFSNRKVSDRKKISDLQQI